jgi:hypothetical protein
MNVEFVIERTAMSESCMPEQCAFCENPADSREHLWGEWIGKLLGPRQYEIRQVDGNGEPKVFPKVELDVKSWEVCDGCNTGWMSDIENEARHLSSIGHFFSTVVACSRAQRISPGGSVLTASGVYDLLIKSFMPLASIGVGAEVSESVTTF